MKTLRLRTPVRRILALLLTAVLFLSVLPVPPVWANSEADTIFTFSDSGITASGADVGYTISGTDLTITAAGTYRLTGSCADGSVSVNKSLTGVILILENLALTSTYAGPIVCNKNTEVTIEAVGTSTLTETGSSSEGAGIKAKGSSKLILTGSGTLNVVGNIKNGIKGAAETEITVSGLNLHINAVSNALASDGSVVINSGTLNLIAGNDAIKSEPEVDDTASAGTVTVNGGTIKATAVGDGIQSTGACTITGGNFDFTTGGGYTTAVGTDSTKGIKSDTAIIIFGGTFNLNCSDDTLHSNGDVTLIGGTYTLYTGGDAIHADYNLTIGTSGTTDGPNITVASCYEGFEGAVISLYGGSGSIVSSDDGMNAANSALSNYNFKLLVYGGSWYVNAGGDGVDANGDIYLYGGTIESYGSASSSDAALDFDGSCYALGGTILAVGMSGMAQAPTSGVYIKFGSSSGGAGQSGKPGQSGSSISIKSGSNIAIKDSSGSTVYSATGIKSANSVVFTSDTLIAGNTYYLYIDGTSVASVSASGTSSTGTVTGVSISPSSAAMNAGESMIFTATVSGTNSPSQSVTWSVTGGSEGTVISSGGKLTVAADETAKTLTLTAVSAANPGKYATATVTVNESVSSVTGVTVSPSAVTLVPGATQSFTASVEGGTSQSVTWEVEGAAAGTSIASDGTLTIASDETAETLTVTATSTADESKFGTAVVTVEKSTVIDVSITLELLAEKIAEAKAKTGAYTDDSWQALEDAINEAEAVLAKDGNATQEEIEDAYIALQAAVDGLKKTTDSEIAVDIPTNMAPVRAAAKAIKVSWTKGGNADGTELWYATIANGTYKKLTSSAGTAYIHGGLTIGSTYYYKARSYKTVNGVTYYSGYTAVKSYTVEVPAPTGLKIYSAGAVAIKISWNKINDVTGYEIYRSTSKNGEYTKVGAAVGAGKTTYTNKNLINKKVYFYKIKAYKTIGGVKVYSDFSSSIKMKADLTKPQAQASSSGNNAITVKWNKVSGATKYQIYRAASKNGTYKLVKTVKKSELKYVDKKTVKGKQYYYKVKAVQKLNKKTYSSVFSLGSSAKAK